MRSLKKEGVGERETVERSFNLCFPSGIEVRLEELFAGLH